MSEFLRILFGLYTLEAQVNALQTAIATLTTNVAALSTALAANQASSFTPTDVADVNNLASQVASLTASLAPAPAPAPPAS